MFKTLIPVALLGALLSAQQVPGTYQVPGTTTQTKTVFVHKLVCQGTLEERIDALLSEKRSLADAIIGSGDAWLSELSTEELRELLRLDATASRSAESAGAL